MYFLNQNIKYLRALNGLTQPQLGEVLGVSRDNVASYERGTVPPVDIIHKFVNHFHIDFNELIEKDLSKIIHAEVADIDREAIRQSSPEKPVNLVSESKEDDRFRSIEALEKIVEAQEVTIKSQQETIEALKMVLDNNSKQEKK